MIVRSNAQASWLPTCSRATVPLCSSGSADPAEGHKSFTSGEKSHAMMIVDSDVGSHACDCSCTLISLHHWHCAPPIQSPLLKGTQPRHQVGIYVYSYALSLDFSGFSDGSCRQSQTISACPLQLTANQSGPMLSI